ncbi:MAG: helix-turn-helix transcriptional regulator [Planctomycetota bacterium]
MNDLQIGRQITALRVQAGISMAQLAEQIGKSQATISRIENGKQGTTIEMIASIAHALQVHPFALLGGTGMSSALSRPRLLGKIRKQSEQGGMRYLAQILTRARGRAHLMRETAAEALGIPEADLVAFEEKGKLLDEEILKRMGELYTIDQKEILALAEMQRQFPELSLQLAAMDSLLAVFLHCLREKPELLSNEAERDSVVRELELCLGISEQDLLAAERKAHYFSIGHLSDRLLVALQDPEFHAMVEELARNYPGPSSRKEAAEAPEEERDANT